MSEAEYVTLTSATKEAVWLRRLPSDIGNSPSLFCCDNAGQGDYFPSQEMIAGIILTKLRQALDMNIQSYQSAK